MAIAAVAGRYSRALPLLSGEPRAIAAYAPVLLLLIPAIAVAAVVLVGGLVAIVASRIPRLPALWHDHRVVVAGRVVLTAAGLVALPGFIAALAQILQLT
jgi:hypothetical protein